jgi:hypothetical protein
MRDLYIAVSSTKWYTQTHAGFDRGVSWLNILRYKNMELTLTTRQLHSRELFAAAALPTARPTQS